MIMEQEEIARRNIAIAVYMGWQVTNDVVHGGKIACDRDSKHGYTYWTSSPPFNVDWNLLMPTVEKIMREFSENIHSWLPMSSDNPKMFHSKLHGAFWLIEGMDKPLIERVWLAVSEYVLSLKS